MKIHDLGGFTTPIFGSTPMYTKNNQGAEFFFIAQIISKKGSTLESFFPQLTGYLEDHPI